MQNTHKVFAAAAAYLLAKWNGYAHLWNWKFALRFDLAKQPNMGIDYTSRQKSENLKKYFTN